MRNFLKPIKSLSTIIMLGAILSGCQSISTTGTSTHASVSQNQTSTLTDRKAKWDERVSSIRETQQQRILKARERRAELAEARKKAVQERKALAEQRREAAKDRLASKSVKKSKNQTKINRAFAKAKDDKNTSLRTGWVKIDGKFVYRSAKTIKAEQEAAKKAAAAKRAASKKRRHSNPKGSYGKLIAKYAAQHGVPYRLARAVVQVESSFRAGVTGGAGEIGLMQIKLATARGMGYKGSRKQLYNPATNLYWGMKYLGKAHRLAGGSTCGTILRYNAGHGAKRMNPVSRRYCNRVSRII